MTVFDFWSDIWSIYMQCDDIHTWIESYHLIAEHPESSEKRKSKPQWDINPRAVVIKRIRDNKCWRGYRPKAALVQCWYECKLVQLIQKAMWRGSQKIKIELPYDPAIPLLSIYPNETKTRDWRDTCPPIFTAALFTTAKRGDNLRACQQINGYRRCAVHTQGNIIQPEKEGNPAICKNIDGPWKHYATWVKSDRQRQNRMISSLVCTTSLESPKKPNW